MRADVVAPAGPGELDALVWRTGPSWVASSASCGGGVGERHWVVNAQVPANYQRTDLEAHASELARAFALVGDGVTLFTAASVRGVREAADAGLYVQATVGVAHPTWAAADDADAPTGPGTINVVAFAPVRWAPGALLNALVTATEAKTQALLELGIPGTGTASDAICVVCPLEGPSEPFAGPRSHWGAALARAVHACVLAGAVAPS